MADVVLVENAATPDPLFAHVMGRRSCKEPLSDQPVANDMVAKIVEFVMVYTDTTMVDALENLTWEAWKLECYLPRTMKESVDLMRRGKAKINAKLDGIDMGGPFLESLMLAGVMTRAALNDQDSTTFKQGKALY